MARRTSRSRAFALAGGRTSMNTSALPASWIQPRPVLRTGAVVRGDEIPARLRRESRLSSALADHRLDRLEDVSDRDSRPDVDLGPFPALGRDPTGLAITVEGFSFHAGCVSLGHCSSSVRRWRGRTRAVPYPRADRPPLPPRVRPVLRLPDDLDEPRTRSVEHRGHADDTGARVGDVGGGSLSRIGGALRGAWERGTGFLQRPESRRAGDRHRGPARPDLALPRAC